MLVLFLSSVVSFAQTTVSGVVKESNTQTPIPGANIKVVGTKVKNPNV